LKLTEQTLIAKAHFTDK